MMKISLLVTLTWTGIAQGWMMPGNHHRHYVFRSSRQINNNDPSRRSRQVNFNNKSGLLQGIIARMSISTTTTQHATSEQQYHQQQQKGDKNHSDGDDDMFETFVNFLITKQSSIIEQLEGCEQLSTTNVDATAATFSRDAWGVFDEHDPAQTATATGSGGITRVLQGGNIIEKGACSLTVIRKGTLSAERAATIRARQDVAIESGDQYDAAALSMVLHSRRPHVPTFRSDVRVFRVRRSSNTAVPGQDEKHADKKKSGNDDVTSLAWFGGGADLTPYYLYDEDISFFHGCYKDLCEAQQQQQQQQYDEEIFSYPAMKKSCDDYFYLPARSEHRGTGGIFFDDVVMNAPSLAFVQGVVETWMPSWLPIVDKRQDLPVTEQQRQWQLLRRGRYLEFNLLYDRGVKFGLANANPRVEGVMVSAPPLIAFEYNHEIVPGSEEDRLVQILKKPQEWI